MAYTLQELGIDGNGILQPLLCHRFRMAFFNSDDKEIEILTVQAISAEGFYLSDQGDSIRLHFEVDVMCQVLKALEELRKDTGKATIKIHVMNGDSTVLLTIILKKCEMREMFIGQDTCQSEQISMPLPNEKDLKKQRVEVRRDIPTASTFSFDYSSNNSMKAKVEFDYMDYELEFPAAS